MNDNRLFLAIVTMTVVWWSVPANAGTKQEIAKCAAMEGGAERLVCYDGLAETLGIASPASTAIRAGKWSVREEVSPIDDSRNVYLTLNADQPIRSGYNSVQPTLVLRCAENRTSAFVSWNLYLGLEKTSMLIRLDKEPAKTTEWYISTDNKAVFVAGSDIKFAKSLMGHSSLLAQITPYGKSPVMATFSIAGLDDAIRPLRSACNW